MVRVILDLKQPGWVSVAATSVKGAAFHEGRLLSAGELAGRMAGMSIAEVASYVGELNGFWAIVHGDSIWMDQIRSTPLYYTRTREGDWRVTDTPEATQSRDPLASAEFILAGYVTGERTLDPALSQANAGTFVEFSRSDAAPRSWYAFEPNRSGNQRRELEAEWGSVLREAIQRLIIYAEGAQIAIPLSGGLDSRIIALHLKIAGYSNVVCFSYGVRGNRESQISEKVAAAIGFPWHFVEYDGALWSELRKSRRFAAYLRRAHANATVPHVQDWPAIGALLQRGVLTERSVVVPGHSGDFVAGSHLVPILVGEKSLSSGELVEEVWRRHFQLNLLRRAANRSGKNPRTIRREFHERIRRQLALQPGELVEPRVAASLYERWDWQERQAKFVTHSVRVYDDHNVRWWLPLWDMEVMRFWASVPTRLRWNKILYDGYARRMSEQFGITDSGIDPVVRRKRLVLSRLPHPILTLYRRFRGYARRRQVYSTHPLAWFTLVGEREFKRWYTGQESINSFLALRLAEPPTLEDAE